MLGFMLALTGLVKGMEVVNDISNDISNSFARTEAIKNGEKFYVTCNGRCLDAKSNRKLEERFLGGKWVMYDVETQEVFYDIDPFKEERRIKKEKEKAKMRGIDYYLFTDVVNASIYYNGGKTIVPVYKSLDENNKTEYHFRYNVDILDILEGEYFDELKKYFKSIYVDYFYNKDSYEGKPFKAEFLRIRDVVWNHLDDCKNFFKKWNLSVNFPLEIKKVGLPRNLSQEQLDKICRVKRLEYIDEIIPEIKETIKFARDVENIQEVFLNELNKQVNEKPDKVYKARECLCQGKFPEYNKTGIVPYCEAYWLLQDKQQFLEEFSDWVKTEILPIKKYKSREEIFKEVPRTGYHERQKWKDTFNIWD